ncbi:unnamed protein product [Polarella glacialis]|uniref:Uncharacterized protein n=1 Tax=Polarella glacialis TaxID=89957 RepID=A0A813L2R9_POLGL|nr:unnamed protein product [Polarella glacialis]
MLCNRLSRSFDQFLFAPLTFWLASILLLAPLTFSDRDASCTSDGCRSQGAGLRAEDTEGGAIRVVVSRKESDDTNWLSDLANVPYELWTEMADGSHSTESLKKGERLKPRTVSGSSTRDCGGYLSFIIDHYNLLPNLTVFLHGTPCPKTSASLTSTPTLTNVSDYHSDSHIFWTIQRMAIDQEKVGYCSLNSLHLDWRSARGQPWYVTGLQRTLQDARFDEVRSVILSRLPSAGTSCFCCSQFAVSRKLMATAASKTVI